MPTKNKENALETSEKSNTQTSSNELQNQTPPTKDTKLSGYAWISFILSILLGGAYIYLFCWIEPGISYLIYYFLMLLFIIIPVFIVEKQEAVNKFSVSGFILILISFLPLIFLYRLNTGWLAFAFVTLPIIFGVSFSALFSDKTYNNFGIFSFLSLPVILFISWFGDTFKYLKNFSFRGIKNPKVRSYIARSFKGIIVAIPFLFIIIILLSSADQMFSKLLSDFFQNSFGSWFKDFDSTVSTLAKLFIGGCISVYSMVYLFSLWNKESVLHTFLRKNGDRNINEAKKNWDVVVTAVFMGLLNLVFILFVIVQVKYMFGGEANVIGSGANFSYAEYARRGFTELLIVSALVYAIVLVMNLKVYAANLFQKLVFRGNFTIMVFCALVINYSSFSRLLLYESVYGFTNLRVMVDFAIVIITALYLCLLISSLLKSPWKFINASTAIIGVLAYCAFVSVPTDSIVAKLNYNRYKENGKIDISYLTTLSDEAIPVLVEIVRDETIDENVNFMLKADLEKRYERIKDSRVGWQSYNVTNQYNLMLLREALEIEPGITSDGYKWRSNAEMNLETFLDGYTALILAGEYEEAYNQYWSSYSEMLDPSDLSEIRITKYEVTSVPEYSSWNVVNTTEMQRDDYWSGQYVDIDFEYEVKDTYGIWRKQCTYDSLRLILEDGQWKIKYSDMLTLGNFKDGGSEVSYYENSSLDYILDYESYRDCEYNYDYDGYRY